MADSKKTKKELIEAVEALRESEEKWYSLAENAPNIIMVVDRDGVIQFVNRTPPGFTIEEAIGKNIYDYLSPEHRKVAKEAIEQVFQTGKLTHYENIGPGPHGRDSWYDTQVGAIKSDGHVVAATLFVTDITEHKKAEELLQESEKKWHLLAENIPDVILTVGKDSRIRFLNRTVAGHDSESAIGTIIYEYVPPDQHHIMRESIERVFLTGKPDSYEIDGVGEHGPNTKWETRVVPIMRDGQVVAVNLISTDVTERKKAEDALGQSEEKYRSLITNIPDVTWTTDCEGKTTFISPNIEKAYGFTPEEVYRGGSHIWLGRVHPDDAEHIKETYESLFTENKMFDVEYRIQRKDGRWIWLRDRAVVTYEKNGVMYADGIFSDITERKKAEEAMRAERNKAQRYLDIAGVMLIVVNSEQAVKLINKRGCEILGYKEEEIIGKNWFDNFVPEISRNEAEKVFQRLMAGEAEPVEYYENPVITKSGEEKIIAWHNTVLKNE